MTPLAAKLFHLACMVAWWIIRRPFERKVRRNVIARDGLDLRERILLAISFSGLGIIPAVYVATGFPAALDQEFSAARAWMGAALFLAALVLFRATHKALGRNWSVTLKLREGHELITDGVYRWIRHPMYTAFWMWAVAQALLLQNWLAGPAGLIGFGTLYVFRIGREEALMRSRFGEQWDAYAARTRRILPFLH
jgi:protein-S-isoprenylcysteine O-methyltransferase Ste14